MTEADDFGLKPKVGESLRALFRNHSKIEKVVLYGSRAKGTFKSGSDIDLAIVAPQLDLSDLLRIENEIDDLLLPYKVDLSLLHQIENPDLVDHIDRVGVLFYAPS